MPISKRLPVIARICGISLLILGALDPLEGSVLIAAGSLMVLLEARISQRYGYRLVLLATLMVLLGVAYLFWVSSLGGIGGNTGRSYWWALGIAPYPIGWLMLVGWLLYGAFRRTRAK
jgi:hypothetical protein